MKLDESSDNQTEDRIRTVTRLRLHIVVAGGGRGGAVQGGVVRGRQDHLRHVHLRLPVPHPALRLR